MYRITTAAIKWYAEGKKGDLEQMITEAIEAAIAAHHHIKDLTDRTTPREVEEC